MIKINITPLSTLYNSLILKGLKFNNFLAKNCKPSIYKALEKRVESQVNIMMRMDSDMCWCGTISYTSIHEFNFQPF